MLLNLTDLSAEPLYKQISSQLARRIMEAELAAGDPLPPVSVLAKEHRVSKTTVRKAYHELARRGLIACRAEDALVVAARREQKRYVAPVHIRKEFEVRLKTLRSPSEGYRPALGSDGKCGLHVESFGGRQLEEELIVARRLQTDLLPVGWHDENGLALAAYTCPCHAVGGDFYDYFTIDDTHVGLVVADASGKGLPAALLTSQVQAILKTGVGNGDTIGRTLVSLNSHLVRNTALDYFATLFYGVYDRQAGCLEYANAGHDFPILARTDGAIDTLESTGPALGVVPEYAQRTEAVGVGPGDCILFYTDGITDTTDTAGRQYGVRRLESLLINNRSRTPQEIIDLIRADLDEFSRRSAHQDDRTLMLFKVAPVDQRESDAA